MIFQKILFSVNHDTESLYKVEFESQILSSFEYN